MHEHHWTSMPPAVGQQIQIGQVTATLVPVPSLTLVSGKIEPFGQRWRVPIVGFGERAPAENFLLRQARDRALWVAPPAERPPYGWHRETAISPFDGGCAVIEIGGEGVEMLLQQGTSADLSKTSPCASLLFAGHSATLASVGDRWWLFVEPAMLAYFWHWVAGSGS